MPCLTRHHLLQRQTAQTTEKLLRQREQAAVRLEQLHQLTASLHDRTAACKAQAIVQQGKLDMLQAKQRDAQQALAQSQQAWQGSQAFNGFSSEVQRYTAPLNGSSAWHEPCLALLGVKFEQHKQSKRRAA